MQTKIHSLNEAIKQHANAEEIYKKLDPLFNFLRTTELAETDTKQIIAELEKILTALEVDAAQHEDLIKKDPALADILGAVKFILQICRGELTEGTKEVWEQLKLTESSEHSLLRRKEQGVLALVHLKNLVMDIENASATVCRAFYPR